MMGSQWLLLMMVLTSSSSVEGQSDTGERFPWDETCHLGTLPSTLIRVITPPSAVLFENEDGQQREPFQPVGKDDKKIYASKKYLTSLAAAAGESVNSSPRSMNMMEKSLKTLEILNSKDVLRQLTAAAPVGQVGRAVDRQEFKEGYLVLAGDSQQAVPQDLLHNPGQVVQMNTTEDIVEIVLESPVCRGYLSLPEHPEPLPTNTSSIYDYWKHHGSGRTRRSPFNTDAGLTYCDNCSLALSLARAAAPDLTLVDLVLYLISLTSGRQFYLVYDDVTPGVEDVVRSLQEVLGDTILLPYDPSLLLLTEALTSNYHVHHMRNVFILCSANHLTNLFDQVRNKVLESPTIQWFVIVDKDMTEDLPVLLREGTQVALVQRLTPQKAQLFSSRVNPDGQIGFHHVGWWSVSGTRRTTSHQVKGGLVPDLQQLYSNFQGRQLLITTLDNWPYFKIKTLKNGTVLPAASIEVNIINTLSEKLNFTYQLVLPPDGMWGGPKPDGTITGLVGQVARHEVHVTVCELTITGIRETVVDFTTPYYLESMTVVSPAPKEKNRAFAVLSPFTVEVWLYICLVTVLVGPLLYMVTRLLVVYLGEEDSPHYSLQSFSFNMYRNLVVQGNLITSHRWSLRFIFFFWYLYCLYIYAMYSGTLTAALAVTSFEKPINSLYDLARAHRDGYTIATAKDTNYETTFREAKSGIYKEVWQLFNHEDRDKSFFPNRVIGMDMLEKHKYVYISAVLGLRLEATRRGPERFYIGRETFLPQGYGIACSSGSPFKDVFSSILIRLIEVGLVSKWMNDEVNKVYKFVSTSSASGPKAISVQHLQAAFFIMALGFSIAALVIVLEILASVSRQSIKQAA